jgi:hypothetical protein
MTTSRITAVLGAVSATMLTRSAAAHEIAGPHMHPHADRAGTIALLVAVAGFCAWLLRGAFRK